MVDETGWLRIPVGATSICPKCKRFARVTTEIYAPPDALTFCSKCNHLSPTFEWPFEIEAAPW